VNDRPRCAFDTNVIVSALLFEHSQPGRAFHAAIDHAELVLSDALFAELSAVLSRKKFDRYFTADQREQFLIELI
jgi:putative PIN family toxin of toxin-antitoxin system